MEIIGSHINEVNINNQINSHNNNQLNSKNNSNNNSQIHVNNPLKMKHTFIRQPLNITTNNTNHHNNIMIGKNYNLSKN